VNEARAELGLDPLEGDVGELLLADLQAGGGPAEQAADAIQALANEAAGDVVDDVEQHVRAEHLIQQGRNGA